MFILRVYINALRKDISLCDDTRTLLCYYGGRGGRSPMKHSSLVLFLLFSLFFNYFKYIYLNII
nr:MAG TPA: hypothetical protein [Caudoviricetes sp.]